MGGPLDVAAGASRTQLPRMVTQHALFCARRRSSTARAGAEQRIAALEEDVKRLKEEARRRKQHLDDVVVEKDRMAAEHVQVGAPPVAAPAARLSGAPKGVPSWLQWGRVGARAL